MKTTIPTTLIGIDVMNSKLQELLNQVYSAGFSVGARQSKSVNVYATVTDGSFTFSTDERHAATFAIKLANIRYSKTEVGYKITVNDFLRTTDSMKALRLIEDEARSGLDNGIATYNNEQEVARILKRLDFRKVAKFDFYVSTAERTAHIFSTLEDQRKFWELNTNATKGAGWLHEMETWNTTEKFLTLVGDRQLADLIFEYEERTGDRIGDSLYVVKSTDLGTIAKEREADDEAHRELVYGKPAAATDAETK